MKLKSDLKKANEKIMRQIAEKLKMAGKYESLKKSY